jgi:hypothetical protein
MVVSGLIAAGDFVEDGNAEAAPGARREAILQYAIDAAHDARLKEIVVVLGRAEAAIRAALGFCKAWRASWSGTAGRVRSRRMQALPLVSCHELLGEGMAFGPKRCGDGEERCICGER